MPHLETFYKKEQLYYIVMHFEEFPINVRVAGLSEEDPDYINHISPRNLTYNCYQMEYITSGSGYIEVDGQTLPVSEGDFFFIKKGQPRTITSDRNNPFTKHYISANGFLLDAMISAYEIEEKAFVLNIDLRAEFEKIFELVKSSPPDSDHASLCDKLGLIIFEIIQKVQSARTPRKSKQNTDVALLIQDYIELNITRNLTLEDLCNHFHLGKTQLIAVFKKRHLCTPMHYHQKRKIDTAMDYFKMRHIKTAEIAEILGFSDVLYFSKVFKKHTGMTVSEYKSATKKK